MRNAAFFDEIDESNRIQHAEDDSGASLIHASHRPAATTDVEQRHCCEVHGVRSDFPDLFDHGANCKEVCIREHHALGQTGGAT